MRYRSTRGDERLLSFEETVLAGLASDGGLFIPEHIPSLPSNWETSWADLSFVDLALEVLSLYISSEEISHEDLETILVNSYSTFRHPEITPLYRLDDKTLLLELFHGPTFAFKDVALQFLGNLFEFFLKRRNESKPESETEKLTVLGATSGDTGSAAIYGLRNKANISIFILYPYGRVSPIQEAQMATVIDPNVHNLAVKGTFDDCQDILKILFSDRSFNTKHRLGAVNSINWARILAQTVYYFLTYLRAKKDGLLNEGKKLQFVVPTGNFGDILAGYYAKRMGLPMDKLIVATNENDILSRFWATGRYEKVPSSSTTPSVPAVCSSYGKQATGAVIETPSPAMDILVSSNFERLLWYLAYEASGFEIPKAGRQVREWMNSVKTDGRCEVPISVLEIARRDFEAARVSNEETLETIRQTYVDHKYVADPHTSVGIHVAKSISSQNSPDMIQIILSTAHPAKFSEAVTAALQGVDSFHFTRDVLPKEFVGLLEKEKRVIVVDESSPHAVKNVIDDIAREKNLAETASA